MNALFLVEASGTESPRVAFIRFTLKNTNNGGAVLSIAGLVILSLFSNNSVATY